MDYKTFQRFFKTSYNPILNFVFRLDVNLKVKVTLTLYFNLIS